MLSMSPKAFEVDISLYFIQCSRKTLSVNEINGIEIGMEVNTGFFSIIIPYK